MVGRQVIITKRAFTLTELEEFMRERWDTENYNDFCIGKPTPASIEEYILLPSTEHYIVCAYSRKPGIFSKKCKVILITADTPAGMRDKFFTSVKSSNIFFGAWKISKTMSLEKERKGPAEENLLRYSEYMKSLLSAAGLTE